MEPNTYFKYTDAPSQAEASVLGLCTTMVTATLLPLLALNVAQLTTSSLLYPSRLDSIYIPITRSIRSRGLRDLAETATHFHAKYNFKTTGSKQNRAGTTAAESLANLVGSPCTNHPH